jgi:hypothetical protein
VTSDIFILGCGRSGTSLVAGLFRNSGLFMGNQLYPPRASNPHGFFEHRDINDLNETLLQPLLPDRPGDPLAGYGWDIPRDRHRWLANLPLTARVTVTDQQAARMAVLTSHKPFCFKDPRFCYTLDVWRAFSDSPKFICVFRDPAACVASIFAECLAMPYFHNLAVSVGQLFQTWVALYRHVLRRHMVSGDWMFVQYEDLLTGRDLARLADFTGLPPDIDFVDASLNRVNSSLRVPQPARAMFDELRGLAASRL